MSGRSHSPPYARSLDCPVGRSMQTIEAFYHKETRKPVLLLARSKCDRQHCGARRLRKRAGLAPSAKDSAEPWIVRSIESPVLRSGDGGEHLAIGLWASSFPAGFGAVRMSEHIAKTDSRTMMRWFFQHQNDTSREPGLAPMNIRFLALVSNPAEIRCPYSSRDFQLFLSPINGISKPPAAYNPTVHSRRNPKPIRCPSDVVSLGDWMKKSAHASSSQELNFFFRSAHVALGFFSLQRLIHVCDQVKQSTASAYVMAALPALPELTRMNYRVIQLRFGGNIIKDCGEIWKNLSHRSKGCDDPGLPGNVRHVSTMHTLRDPDATVAHRWDGGLDSFATSFLCERIEESRSISEAGLEPGPGTTKTQSEYCLVGAKGRRMVWHSFCDPDCVSVSWADNGQTGRPVRNPRHSVVRHPDGASGNAAEPGSAGQGMTPIWRLAEGYVGHLEWGGDPGHAHSQKKRKEKKEIPGRAETQGPMFAPFAGPTSDFFGTLAVVDGNPRMYRYSGKVRQGSPPSAYTAIIPSTSSAVAHYRMTEGVLTRPASTSPNHAILI
ncbi:hypothetical protein An04g09880 [Aspergillus niger]|uniref:Uncharacterized protein n=2 Tax=Aspergillus niger TaxID=5061 RepID=A2QKA1_ASPNC|nr:hypothetical protein An04g09880 [Aspergillus niger]CAK39047.1 hypothetical protein An04g09880 [Aspergillus niger]